MKTQSELNLPANMKLKRRWLELAVLPLLAGIALGSSFGLGGDDAIGKSLATPTFPGTRVSAKKVNPKREISGTMGFSWGLVGTDAPEAWRLTRGSRDIVVAVIDTGCDISHPDLQDNIWTNPGETGLDEAGRDKRSNGIDDDRDGYIDDVYGWNFAGDNDNISDDHGHGTHIAGIIGASGRAQLTGIAPRVSLMPLKYYDPRAPGSNPLSATIKAIHYAIKKRVNIINYSGGGMSASPLELEALNLARAAGILVVAAAGNEQSDSDLRPYYPADYELSNILSVTAIDPRGQVLKSSNWGDRTVDIAAPGERILSTMPGGEYGEMTGTSQATAFATGVAVLLMSSRADLRSPEAVIAHLMATGATDTELGGRVKSRAVLNSYRALAIVGEGVSAAGVAVANESEIDATAFTIPGGR